MDFTHNDPGQIGLRLAQVRQRIVQAGAAAGRSEQTVTLLAVSKGQSARAITQAVAAGQTDFGENYLQEALDKRVQLPHSGLIWHFIGPIQSNKTRALAENFDWVQGVDRYKIAQRLAEQRPAALPPLNICLQVNISGETSKSGVAPDALAPLALEVAALPGLRLRGLMAIPAPAIGHDDARRPFRDLRLLFEGLRAQGLNLDTLSMGMSDDFEAAIAEGSTLVRVGTAIFGARST